MSTKITLKQRPTEERLIIDYKAIEPFLEDDINLEPLRDTLRQANIVPYIHDKRWIEMLINWTPEGGLSLTEMAKWMQLAQKVNGLSDSKECELSLTPFQVNLLWSRMTDDKFKVRSFSVQFAQFLIDFCSKTGKSFGEFDPDEE